jgi:hypothetical protein
MAFTVKAGDPLKLQVVENDAVLHFRAERLQAATAKTPVPRADFFGVLTPGQQEQLLQTVERLTTPSGSSQTPEVLPREILSAVSRIGALFESVPLDQPADKLAVWIKSAVEDRGVFFEKRLADMVAGISSRSPREAESGHEPVERPDVVITRDIKPQLMILKAFLDQAGDSQETISRLNSKVTRWESGAPQQVLVHLWPFQELRAPVELKIYYPPKKRAAGDHRQHRIAILLDMNRLGPVRVDLTMIGENLSIGFYVVSETLKRYFQQELPAVERALAGKFQQLQMDVFVSREKIQRFHQEDLDATTTGGININA